MTSFIPVVIYDLDGNFQGYGIKGSHKMQSTILWGESEEALLTDRLNELNHAQDIRQHWPHPHDPEVQALLDNPEFEPIEMGEVEVVDVENSPRIVYRQIAGPDGWMDSDEFDHAASELAYKHVRVPKRPTDQLHRIHLACERIAKQRAIE